MKSKYNLTHVISYLKQFESLVWFAICSALIVFRFNLN